MPKRNFSQPLWLGDAELRGKTILIHAEQGLVDCIQFFRYLPLLQAGDYRMLFEAPRELIRLLRDQAEGIEFIAKGDDLPHFDFHCPLISLPLAFGTTLATIPAAIPYLRADRDKIAAWRARRKDQKVEAENRACLVGKLSLPHESSIPLASLAPIISEKAEWHVLQKDIRGRDREALSELAPIKNHAELLDDFADTAALISQMIGDLHRHQRRAFDRGVGQAALAVAAVSPGLPLAARSRRQPVVSDGEAVSPNKRRRLECSGGARCQRARNAAGGPRATGIAAGRDALSVPAARRRGNLALKAGTLGLRAPWCSASRNGAISDERQREYAHARLDDRPIAAENLLGHRCNYLVQVACLSRSLSRSPPQGPQRPVPTKTNTRPPRSIVVPTRRSPCTARAASEGAASTRTSRRMRSGCPAISSCRASGFLTSPATCRPVLARTSIGTFNSGQRRRVIFLGLPAEIHP